MLPRFNAEDAQRAWDQWGANCGPGAIATICGLTLDQVRQHMGDFESKHYTNPTLMWHALNSIGRPWRRVGAEWPRYGLARIQWEGPWTEPGVPIAARYRKTHWVGTWLDERRGRGVFDINCIANGTGWVALADWERQIVPALTALYPKASGKWHVTHGVDVERLAAAAGLDRRAHARRDQREGVRHGHRTA